MFPPCTHLSLFLPVLFHSAFAQQTQTVSLLDFGLKDLDGSVITADATATTYKMDCPSSNPTRCGYESGANVSVTAVGGPSTGGVMVTDYTNSTTVDYMYGCKITSSTQTQCSYTATSGGIYDSTSLSSDTTETYIRVVVTAGLEKLPGTSGAPTLTTTGSSMASTAQSSKPFAASTASTASTAGSTQATSTGAAASPSSTSAAAGRNIVHSGGVVAGLVGMILMAVWE